MEILLKSLAAAVITALILLLERYAGPRIAGAIGGIPIVFAVSFVLVTMQHKNITQISEFLLGGVIGAVAGVLFCIVLWYLNKHYIDYYWWNFAGSYLLCFLFALLSTQLVLSK